MTKTIALILSSLLAATVAAAPTPARTTCGDVRSKERCKDLTIEPEDVDGRRVGPGGEMVVARGQLGFGSLIRPRTSFVREIVRSAELVR